MNNLLKSISKIVRFPTIAPKHNRMEKRLFKIGARLSELRHDGQEKPVEACMEEFSCSRDEVIKAMSYYLKFGK